MLEGCQRPPALTAETSTTVHARCVWDEPDQKRVVRCTAAAGGANKNVELRALLACVLCAL